MIDIQRGEIILSIVGISSVINGQIPRWTLDKMREFDNFKTKIDELAADSISGSIKLGTLPREHNYEETLGRIKAGMKQSDYDAVYYKFPEQFHQMAADFIVTLQNSWAHLAEIFPISEYLTFMGPVNLTPTGEKTWEFFNKLLVLNNPLSVYMLISSGAMLPSQAEAVKEFFPTLSENITQSLYAAIATKKATDGDKFRMPERVSWGLANWLGRRTVDYDPNPQPMPAPTNGLPKTSPAGASEVALSPTQRITDGAH